MRKRIAQWLAATAFALALAAGLLGSGTSTSAFYGGADDPTPTRANGQPGGSGGGGG